MQRISVLAIALGSLLLVHAGSVQGVEPRKAALTKEQMEQHTKVLAEFRKLRTAPPKRIELIERVELAFTLKACLEIVGKELNKPLADYRQQFMKAAARAVAGRTNVDNVQEITELRSQVLDLAKQEKLTKQMIVETSDPALARLKALIIFNREDVLKHEPDLEKRRSALVALGEPWEKCAARLLERQAAEEAVKPKPKNVGASPQDQEAPSPPSFEQYLVKEEELASALAMPMDAATRTVLATNAQLAGKLDPEEARCVLDLNLTRNLLGLGALQIDVALTAAARDHSTDMESLNFFSHDSPVPGKATPEDRAQRAGTSASGENIAAGTLDGAVANKMWWHSPGHHKNMLGNHARVGLGCSGKYWTEMFGR